jgi:hypothetical protein
VKIRIVRRWAVVAAGVALLCGLPVIASALPVSVPQLTASQLRARILASADESYAGYAESNATFGLPPVSGLTGLTSLLNGVTKMRVWQATPGRWRVDVLSDAGERDTYQLSGTAPSSGIPAASCSPRSSGRRCTGCRARPTWYRRRWPSACCRRGAGRPGSA